MAIEPTDPRWPKLLSLSVHEFRTPMTVVAGYIRMLLKDRAGPVSDPQRKLLEEAERSCGRLAALLAEVSDLSNLEAGTSTLDRQAGDLHAILREAAAALPPLPDREVQVDVRTPEGPAPVRADATRLRLAFTSIIGALRRELVASDRLFVHAARDGDRDRPVYDVRIGDQANLDAMHRHVGDLPVFDEWRGGCGLSLPVARRVIDAHGGRLFSAPDNRKAGARIILPAP